MKFPKILAAARQIELDQWQLGEALIEECGPPASAGGFHGGFAAQNQDDSLLCEASEFLRGYGLEYSQPYLSLLRSTAFNFKGRDRKSNLSWSVHKEAKTADNLRTVLATEPKPTRDLVREKVREMEGRELRETSGREYPTKRPDLAEQRPSAAVGLEIVSDTLRVLRDLKAVSAEFNKNFRRIDEDSLKTLNETLLNISEISRKDAATANPSKRAYLAVVGE